ncbi:OLC1v1032205C1 [Oldenlandia corymbosa var. corymbosa]|uniref:OLC1v1032205C1 n=1 Tax=Oldenlandia corymbosa var. corymbosa TaxID=529605 RepID=A0AAV1CL49_OLDCO|nr:OLC1v1032205C1 [Oldenlandia corymbosa var. corymbosa]
MLCGSNLEGRGGEVQLGCTHTIRSHGATVARVHLHDWLILLLLVFLEIGLNIIHPFYRFVGEGMLEDLKYPMKDNTVPIWAVPVYAVLLPIAIFLIFYCRRKDVYDLHNSILGLLFAVLITGVITDAIKDATGRPRPDFFWRCFPDGIDKYDKWGNVACHGKESDIREGHKSFPSGHTSWSFAGLGFLSLYLAGKIKAFDRRGHVAKLCIVFLPLLAAALVAVSRVDDYWHHWQDVFAGALIGEVVAIFCYLQFFPPPYHVQGWGPYAYHRAVEELARSNPTQTVPSNGIGSQPMEVQAEINDFLGKAARRSSLHIRSAEMPAEIQLGAHTIRSHGVQVARFHMHDWLILFLLVAIDIGLNVIQPFHRFVGVNMMTDLQYPLQANTIPFWAVPIIAMILPLTVIMIFYFIRRDVYDLHQAVLGLMFSVLITAVITDAIKDAVGRPRPDFFWRCFPDGKGSFDPVTGDVRCTGVRSVIKEGHKSFPSGHTSWSFAGLGFLSWYLSGKLRAFDRRGHVAKLCIVFLPLLAAALVGVSRVDDYWHHWQDVFAGGLIGLTVASFCYLQFFPPPYDVDGWGPHAYFQMLADSQNGNQSESNANAMHHLTVRPAEMDSVYGRSHQGMETSDLDSSPRYDDLESRIRY